MALETDPLDPEETRKRLEDLWADVDRWLDETHNGRITPERARKIKERLIPLIVAWKEGTVVPRLAEMLLREEMCLTMAKVTAGALVLCQRLAKQIAEPGDGGRAVP